MTKGYDMKSSGVMNNTNDGSIQIGYFSKTVVPNLDRSYEMRVVNFWKVLLPAKIY